MLIAYFGIFFVEFPNEIRSAEFWPLKLVAKSFKYTRFQQNELNRFESKTHPKTKYKQFHHVQFFTQARETVYSNLIQQILKNDESNCIHKSNSAFVTITIFFSFVVLFTRSFTGRYLLKLSLWCRLLRVSDKIQ